MWSSGLANKAQLRSIRSNAPPILIGFPDQPGVQIGVKLESDWSQIGVRSESDWSHCPPRIGWILGSFGYVDFRI